jgi:uncharacterized phage protein (TIGR01671 family)
MRFRYYDLKQKNMFYEDFLITPFGNIKNRNDYYLMLSSGLFDENGKEFFEGDIVKTKIKDGEKDVVCLGVIDYDHDNAAFCIRVGNKKHPINFDTVVLGNIYENKNLLDLEQDKKDE